ncbi:outer membrane protein transport protein [Sulfurimonas sp. MAG313]|nr:outer membrane protein transport protein [Sulfurimonas sp. MAG313]MDF1880377.1 outer membrane protein transport protein [Sulfurimonas sp. MAG313]
MKKSIKLALCLFLVVGTNLVYATNGDNLIATGAKSRAMGGVGIAKSFGAESALANPALLSSVTDMEISGSLSFFTPSVSFKSNFISQAIGAENPAYADSDTGVNIIPEVSFAQRISKYIVYGVSVTGTASMGVDYSNNNLKNGSLNMQTDLQLLKISIPISYQSKNISIGISPIIQFGTLELSHMIDTSAQGVSPLASDFVLLDNGASSDRSLGYEIGLAYDMQDTDVKGLILAMVYKSELIMRYDNTLSASIESFGGADVTGIYSGDNLNQPSEFGLGSSYTFDENTIAFDYKYIAWGDAAGFKDFGWTNQHVFAVGYEYKNDELSMRLGYNYAQNPVSEQDGSSYAGGIKNSFNLAGFPGIVEHHFTFGGSYFINDEVELDFAVVYTGEARQSYDTSAVTRAFIESAGGTYLGQRSSADVKHSQFALSWGASYKF